MTARKTCALMMLGFFAALGSGVVAARIGGGAGDLQRVPEHRLPPDPDIPQLRCTAPHCTANPGHTGMRLLRDDRTDSSR